MRSSCAIGREIRPRTCIAPSFWIRARAFTLVEMLVVMTIVTMLMFVTIPALPGLLGPKGMNRAVSEIHDLMEYARNQAMTSSRTVYICFLNSKDALGSDELQAFIMTSDVNRPTMLGSERKLRDVRLLTRLHRWEDIRMVAFADLDSSVRGQRFPGVASKSLVDQKPLKCAVDPVVPVAASMSAIAFTPQGRAILFSTLESPNTTSAYVSDISINTPYERFVDLALIPTRSGQTNPNNPDQAALVLNGASGYIQILRR